MSGNTRNGSAETLTANDLQRYVASSATARQLMVGVFIDNAGPGRDSADSDFWAVVSDR
jgi:hypothetical protein